MTVCAPAPAASLPLSGTDFAHNPPRDFVFLLLDRFTMMAFAAALEPLRIANRLAGRELYRWRLAGETGTEAVCSNGTRVALDMGLSPLRRDEAVLVCGGIDVQAASTRPVLGWLRREARRAGVMGGLCTGSYTLAKAGLLDGYSATIHWENQDGFTEDFADVQLEHSVFVLDRHRWSSAGGTAALDLMLAVIAAGHGAALAGAVADQLIYSAIRNSREAQRMQVATRIGVRHPKLTQVIELMEAHLEEPLSPAELAAKVMLSARQLERLFRRYLNRSPKRYYMELRLAKARGLLLQTQMRVINVALACGFASASHFSKCYRALYGATPYRERGLGVPETKPRRSGPQMPADLPQ